MQSPPRRASSLMLADPVCRAALIAGLLWLVLTAAYTAQLLGECVWSGYDYLSADGPPEPSLADIGYLSASVLTVVAILLGFGGVGLLRRLRGLLDTGLIVLSLGALCWQLYLEPQLPDVIGLPDVVTIAYPVLDVAMICCLGIVGVAGHRAVPLALRLVGLAGALNAVSDIGYTYLLVFGDYDSGSWINVCFEAGAVCAFVGAVVAVRLPEPPAQPQSFDRGFTLLPIAIATGVTFTLVAFEKSRTGTVSTLTLLVGGVLFLTVLLRQYLFVADRAALAGQLRRALLEQRRLAITDGLTGLYNRRFLTERMAAQPGREAEPVSLLVVDLDHFKKVNDTYGHPAGDAVLQESAARILNTCRATDVVARYGGEKFVVLLPGTGESEALVLAERIRGALRGAPVTVSGTPIAVSASVGVATVRGGDPWQLMESADRALYRAKREGRDRVAVLLPDPGRTTTKVV